MFVEEEEVVVVVGGRRIATHARLRVYMHSSSHLLFWSDQN